MLIALQLPLKRLGVRVILLCPAARSRRRMWLEMHVCELNRLAAAMVQSDASGRIPAHTLGSLRWELSEGGAETSSTPSLGGEECAQRSLSVFSSTRLAPELLCHVPLDQIVIRRHAEEDRGREEPWLRPPTDKPACAWPRECGVHRPACRSCAYPVPTSSFRPCPIQRFVELVCAKLDMVSTKSCMGSIKPARGLT